MVKKDELITYGFFSFADIQFFVRDNGEVIAVRAADENTNLPFGELREALENNTLTISTDFKWLIYVYGIRKVEFINKNEVRLTYTFRIKTYTKRHCTSIIFSSRDIDVFGQNDTFVEEICKSIEGDKVKLSSGDINADFAYRGKKYTLSVYNGLSGSKEIKHNISFSTFIKVRSIESIQPKEAFEIFKLIRSTISFLAYRANIDFDYISLADEIERQNSAECGEMYIPSNVQDHLFKNYPSNPMIKSDSIKDKIANIIEAIDAGIICCTYVPCDSDSLTSEFISAAAWSQMFFRQFAEHNAEYVQSGRDFYYANKFGKNAKQKKVCFLDMLLDLNNGTGSIASSVIQANYESFGIFEDWNECVLNGHIEKSMRRIVDIRNDFCHGRVDFSKESYNFFLLDLANLKVILYGSILKYIGIDGDDAKKALSQLFIMRGG